MEGTKIGYGTNPMHMLLLFSDSSLLYVGSMSSRHAVGIRCSTVVGSFCWDFQNHCMSNLLQ